MEGAGLVHDVGYEVESLLGVKARDEADEGDVRLLWEAELSLERRLACGLAGEIIGIVVGRNVFVSARRPGVIVNAVDNAPDILAALDDQVGDVPANRGVPQLFGILLADSVDHVCEDHANPGQVEVAVAERVADAGVARIQPHSLEDAVGECALVCAAEVVTREYRRVGQRAQLAVGGDERCVPVVEVNDVGLEIERFDGGEYGAAEEGEALGVVRIGAARGAVYAFAVEVVVVLDEIDGDLAPRQVGHVHGAATFAGGHGHADGLDGPLHLRGVLCGYAVLGHGDADVYAEFRQRFGQASGNVSESADLGKRVHFG